MQNSKTWAWSGCICLERKPRYGLDDGDNDGIIHQPKEWVKTEVKEEIEYSFGHSELTLAAGQPREVRDKLIGRADGRTSTSGSLAQKNSI